VKQHSDIRALFLPWAEHRLDQQSAREIEEHLSGCVTCKQYFETMTAAVVPSALQPGRLQVDPYLPARIRALVGYPEPLTGKQLVARWSLRTAAFAAAIGVGIYIGETLSYQRVTVTDQRIISEYSSYLAETGIGERWQTVALVTEGGQK
jgi:hypothetical protein